MHLSILTFLNLARGAPLSAVSYPPRCVVALRVLPYLKRRLAGRTCTPRGVGGGPNPGFRRVLSEGLSRGVIYRHMEALAIQTIT